MTGSAGALHSPHVTEEEIGRRLAACYRLLLNLAEKGGHEKAAGDPGPAPPGKMPAFERDREDKPGENE